MWSTFVNWAQRQLWPESHDTDAAVPPLPFLPAPLSPSESVAAQDAATTAPAAPHNGIFFERLSPDLRRMVLIEAFGDRAVHMDLRYDRPLRARPPRKTMHAGGVDVLDQGHSASRQMRKPRAWQWYSCVCHRNPVWFVERWHGAKLDEGDMASHPALDSCLRRSAQSCDGPPGDTGDMSRCFLGVMGWLMTCRQAYVPVSPTTQGFSTPVTLFGAHGMRVPDVGSSADRLHRYFEGIDILYSTNRFDISSMPLIQHLPRLLPSRALSDIQSVEMCWELGQVAQPPITDQDISAEPRFDGWRTFKSLLGQLPMSLPHLRYLHLTLRGIWFPPQMAVNDLVRHSEPAMLQPLDEMVRELYRSSGWSTPRYIVAIPANVFRARTSLDNHILEDGSEGGSQPAPKRKLVWRPLEPESARRSGLHDEAGYWLESDMEGIFLLGERTPSYNLSRPLLPSIALAGDW